jgi:hypothetical protein
MSKRTAKSKKRERDNDDDDGNLQMATTRALLHVMEHQTKVADRIDKLSDNVRSLVDVVQMMNIVLADLAKNHNTSVEK